MATKTFNSTISLTMLCFIIVSHCIVYIYTTLEVYKKNKKIKWNSMHLVDIQCPFWNDEKKSLTNRFFFHSILHPAAYLSYIWCLKVSRNETTMYSNAFNRSRSLSYSQIVHVLTQSIVLFFFWLQWIRATIFYLSFFSDFF